MTRAARIPSPLVGEAESPPGLAFGKPKDRLSDWEGGTSVDIGHAGTGTPLSNSPPQGGRGSVAGAERRSLTCTGEGNAILNANSSRTEALVLLRRAFAEAGLDTPDLDARLLLTEALRVDAAEIAARPDVALGPEAAERLAGFARRRLAGEPIGRILGRREFWSLPFALSPETLEPRPETETVVETALSLVADRQTGLRILDLGTGSGCLLVALLHELPRATGLGIDRSPGALATARRNAMRNGVGDRAAFVASDWAGAINARFDLIVSNPPYIPVQDIAGLAPEVREHDPRAALDGGHDGLAAYRILFAEAAAVLAVPGTLVVEIGAGQEQPVRALAVARNLRVVALARDLGGRPRALALRQAIS